MSQVAPGRLRAPAAAGAGGQARLRGSLGRLGEGLLAPFERAFARILRPRLLREGLAAVARGNLEAAFWLLREQVGRDRDDPRAVEAFWEVALTLGRPEEAAGPMARLVKRRAASGETQRAADGWISLEEAVPGAPVDAATLGRLIPLLKARVGAARGEQARGVEQAWLLRALSRSVEPGAGLSAGLALRCFDEARALDADIARRAAEVALASPDLHEAKRASLEAQLRDLARGPAPKEPDAHPGRAPAPKAPEPHPGRAPAARAPVARPERAPAPSVPERRPERAPAPSVLERGPERAAEPPPPEPRSEGAAEAPAGAFVVTEVTPVEIDDRGLVMLDVETSLRSRVPHGGIEAVSVARVAGLGPQPSVIVDLVLAGRPPATRGARSLLRLHGDAIEGAWSAPDGEPLRAFLSELLEHTHAVPLPDPDAVLGPEPRDFEDVASYERQLLARLP